MPAMPGADDYAHRNVRNVKPHIRRAVVNEAAAYQLTISDVVGSVLAARYDLPYVSARTKPLGAEPTGSQFMLRLPVPLTDAIVREARDEGLTESSVVQLALAEHYGLVYTPTRRGRQPRKEDAAA